MGRLNFCLRYFAVSCLVFSLAIGEFSIAGPVGAHPKKAEKSKGHSEPGKVSKGADPILFSEKDVPGMEGYIHTLPSYEELKQVNFLDAQDYIEALKAESGRIELGTEQYKRLMDQIDRIEASRPDQASIFESPQFESIFGTDSFFSQILQMSCGVANAAMPGCGGWDVNDLPPLIGARAGRASAPGAKTKSLSQKRACIEFAKNSGKLCGEQKIECNPRWFCENDSNDGVNFCVPIDNSGSLTKCSEVAAKQLKKMKAGKSTAAEREERAKKLAKTKKLTAAREKLRSAVKEIEANCKSGVQVKQGGNSWTRWRGTFGGSHYVTVPTSCEMETTAARTKYTEACTAIKDAAEELGIEGAEKISANSGANNTFTGNNSDVYCENLNIVSDRDTQSIAKANQRINHCSGEEEAANSAYDSDIKAVLRECNKKKDSSSVFCKYMKRVEIDSRRGVTEPSAR